LKKLFAAVLAFVAVTAHAQVVGAGATFPAPVYSKWSTDYKKETGISVNYQAIGSGGGIKQIEAKTVDFGATDDPMSAADVKAKGLYQFPAVIGGVVPVINVPGIEPGKLVLDGATLAAMMTGKIAKWNDPSIAKLNPGVTLPDLAITPVVRSDSSGTTAVFTDYLAKVSPEFKKTVGAGKTVTWPAKNTTAGKGNAGVAAFVKQINGTIGYVEYAFVKQNKLSYTALKSKKNTVLPSDTTFAEAARSADWSTPAMAVNLTDQPTGWPITSASFILIYVNGGDKSKNTVKYFDWAFSNGNAAADELDYVPLPDKVKTQIRADWRKFGWY
jgi:phosphate transport system substrate-binding protein